MAVAGGGVGGAYQLAVLALQEGGGDAGGLFGGDRLCPQGGQRQGQNEGAEEELFHNGMGIAVFQLFVVSFRKIGNTSEIDAAKLPKKWICNAIHGNKDVTAFYKTVWPEYNP